MKLYFAAFLLLIKSNFSYSQVAISPLVNPDSILIKVSQKINSLKNISYQNSRELNYSSENYRNFSKWNVYYDFQSKDTLTGFKYQIADSTSKQFFNGTEKFDLDTKLKTISIEDHPNRKAFSLLSALYNSIITLKNVLPLLILDKTTTKYVIDTTINNTRCSIINVNIGKRRIQTLGFGFDAMTTKSNSIYKIIVEGNSYLPIAVLQTNDLNNDFIKTSFTSIETNTTSPSELSWYYSTYTNDYKLAAQRSNDQLVANGSLAPDWKLEIYNNNKTISLNYLKGQVILLDFWIKNCGPCIQSVPHLNELQNKFKDKNFKLISINSYDSKEDINWFCNKHKADYPVLLNGKSVAEKYGVSSFPTFFIIDKTGKIIYSSVGYNASTPSEVERIIASSL
ncbi:MAG: TlpA disulfide reductase family protein [Chitinophagaceae bacterium]